MKVITAFNVHVAFPHALRLLEQEGIARDSRNGPVLQMPCPVTTVYTRPTERVMFWAERDANPFFHLYESLWMLAGRNDVSGPARYAKQIAEYSDDGETLHGAYGHRWRNSWDPCDQLQVIAERLRANPEDRRCVLQMWDASTDLGHNGKDVPCNTIATFQRNAAGQLDLTVFCRSNDIVWGCYGANAVHFSFLLEYMALWIGCPIGTYTQVSVNWHGYLDTLEKVKTLRPDRENYVRNPYIACATVPMTGDIAHLDTAITALLEQVDTQSEYRVPSNIPFIEMAAVVLHAHQIYQTLKAHSPSRYTVALARLSAAPSNIDWVIAARGWLERRHQSWLAKQEKVNEFFDIG